MIAPQGQLDPERARRLHPGVCRRRRAARNSRGSPAAAGRPTSRSPPPRGADPRWCHLAVDPAADAARPAELRPRRVAEVAGETRPLAGGPENAAQIEPREHAPRGAAARRSGRRRSAALRPGCRSPPSPGRAWSGPCRSGRWSWAVREIAERPPPLPKHQAPSADAQHRRRVPEDPLLPSCARARAPDEPPPTTRMSPCTSAPGSRYSVAFTTVTEPDTRPARRREPRKRRQPPGEGAARRESSHPPASGSSPSR